MLLWPLSASKLASLTITAVFAILTSVLFDEEAEELFVDSSPLPVFCADADGAQALHEEPLPAVTTAPFAVDVMTPAAVALPVTTAVLPPVLPEELWPVSDETVGVLLAAVPSFELFLFLF